MRAAQHAQSTIKTVTLPTTNVAGRLTAMAQLMPGRIAVVEPLGYDRRGKRQYRQVSFRALDQQSDRIARGLCDLGVTAGARLALLVRPGIHFIALTLGIFKAGAVAILIDPGMGRRNLIRCLSEAQPDGFVAIPVVQAVRRLLRRRFPWARWNVTVGRRWFWGGPTLEQLQKKGSELFSAQKIVLTPFSMHTTAEDPAAIIFTTGSTGPAKGVLYRHGNFEAQVEQLRDFYGLQPGEVDLACFPLFGLFNCVLGSTAVIPDMDASRPAAADPAKIVEAIDDWHVTQAFGSPAIWDRVGRYCQERGIHLATLRRVLSAGAPVPADVLQRMKLVIHPEGDVHTPYGATEALPVASISASEVLGETAAQTARGAGVCVGRRFPGMDWKVIRIVDGPIASLDQVEELPGGEIGELVVHGAVVTREYVTRPEANELGKIASGTEVWHRMGDAGYLDGRGRFWFCGRVAHRVLTAAGPMYPIPCEAIFRQHADVRRAALVGVGPPPRQRPVMILEPQPGRMPKGRRARQAWLETVRRLGREHPLTAAIDDFLVHPAFPVDIRHNAKIFREKLAAWAAGKLRC
jgi:acyl-CoA synthetase (AMP-forming)/AMP-acid ligase II